MKIAWPFASQFSPADIHGEGRPVEDRNGHNVVVDRNVVPLGLELDPFD
jgi:hypothetical protein